MTANGRSAYIDGVGQFILPQITQAGITAGYLTSAGNFALNAGGNIWSFGADGTMLSPYSVKITTTGFQFPDTSIQTTAYTGTANNSLYLGGVAANQYAYANSLTAYQTTSGLAANVATLNAGTATKLATARGINGVAFDGSANVTITAAAGTLTGTGLNSTVINSNLQTVGQLSSLQVSGGATVVNNSATDHYANWGTVGQIFDDGNFHIHAKTGNIWINAIDSSDINLGMQVASGSGSTVKVGGNLESRTPYKAKTAWNAALNTETAAVDNFVYRVTSSGGTFPQFKNNTGGNLNCDWISVATISGTSITQTGSTGTIVSGGSWVTLYNSHGMDSPADMVITHLTDKGNGKVHRITFMRNDDGATTGYSILVEKLW